MIVRILKNSFQLHHQVQITCLQILWKANISASTFNHSLNTQKKWQLLIGGNDTTREKIWTLFSVLYVSREAIEMEICVSPILMRNEDLLLWTPGLESAPLNHPRSLVAEKRAVQIMQPIYCKSKEGPFFFYSSKYGSHSMLSRD